jgi:alkaline phosphatase
MVRKHLIIAVAFLLVGATASVSQAQPKNVIFCIGDGMGFEQVEAAALYHDGPLSFQSFAYQGEITTYSANSSVTDSAAAGTALATGVKVDNGVISQVSAADDTELQTLLEYFQGAGRSTGLVTTTYMTHATPAAFGAHQPSRNDLSQIADDYLNQTRPNVLFGGGANGMSVSAAELAGYTVVTDAAGMLALDTETQTYVSGQFGTSHLPYELSGVGSLPHLSEMTTTALDILDNDSDGFFLMIEGGRIDHSGHENRIDRNVRETEEFANSVQQAINWAAGRDDTLIIVTADHETGGLSVSPESLPGEVPTVSWATTGHTGANVPVYAWGVNAHLISGVMDNTDLWGVATVPEPATMTMLGVGVIAVLARRRRAA